MAEMLVVSMAWKMAAWMACMLVDRVAALKVDQWGVVLDSHWEYSLVDRKVVWWVVLWAVELVVKRGVVMVVLLVEKLVHCLDAC